MAKSYSSPLNFHFANLTTELSTTELLITEILTTELLATELLTTELLATELLTTELLTTELLKTEINYFSFIRKFRCLVVVAIFSLCLLLFFSVPTFTGLFGGFGCVFCPRYTVVHKT